MKNLLIYTFLLIVLSTNAWSLNHEVYLDNAYFMDCDKLMIPVTVKNFTNVGAISLKINYDQQQLEFENVSLHPLISKAVSNDKNGQFTLGFFGDNITLSDGDVLFEMEFHVITTGPGSTNLEWLELPNTGNCELAGTGGVPVYSTSFYNGEDISIPADLEATATFEPILCEGGTTTVNISATGGVLPYSGTGNFTVTAGSHNYKVTDANGCVDEISVTVSQPEPAILHINSVTITPALPVEVGSRVDLTVDFTADNPVDININWGDGTFSELTDEKDGELLLSHVYFNTGVYIPEVVITDNCENSVSEKYEYIVVYDPDGGFVTGGGWFISPPGAYVPDPSTTGKVHFGFVSKYQKGKTIPVGHTEFQFRAADLNFSSKSYEWLVISGKSRAQFKGTGTINGEGDYGFMVSVIDEPNNKIDKFRIKIWNKNDNDEIIYDNKEEMEIGGGSIVIHTTNNKSKDLITGKSLIPVSKQFELMIFPNPFSERLKLEFISHESVNFRIDIFDMNGRLVRTIFEQNVESGVLYKAEFKPESLTSATYIYRINVGDEMHHGTVIYRKE